MYVEDVEDGKRTYRHIYAHNFLNIQPILNLEKVLESWDLAFQPYDPILCILKHVEDVKDRSNAPKGCNAMYVEDVKDGKRTYRHILLNTIFDIFDIHTLLWSFVQHFTHALNGMYAMYLNTSNIKQCVLTCAL